MASLYIKDPLTAELAARVARIRGVSKTQAVREALETALQDVRPEERKPELLAWIRDRRERLPLRPTGGESDKTFFRRHVGRCMTLFVDASALVAFIAGEVEHESVAARIASDPDPLWSAMTYWEAVSALRNSYDLQVEEAREEVERSAARMELRLVRIDRGELVTALDAYQRFGKGSGHRARLNMGDCFAYACANTNNAQLLYKGNDFLHTDLA